MKIVGTPKAAVVLVALAAVLGGCTSPGGGPSPTFSANPTTQPPAPTAAPSTVANPSGPYGKLVVAVTSFSDESFDPTNGSVQTTRNLIAPLFDFLLRVKPDGKMGPGLAEKWEMAPDGLSWVFNLRKDVKFHDGEDLTAADVKFTIDRYMTQPMADTETRNMLKSVDIVDDYTVRCNTNGPKPFYPYTLLNAYGVLQGQVIPKDYVEKNGIDYFVRHPVGSGPYKFVRYVAGDMVEYQAMDSHWRQVPDFKDLTLVKIPEESTREAMMKTGAVDIIEMGIDSSASLEDMGFSTRRMSYMQTQVMLRGSYHPKAIAAKMPITDLRVRQALSLAIDRDEIANTFFRGKAVVSGPTAISAASADIDWAYWEEYGKDLNRYDLQEAKRLMAEAGYANGFNIDFISYQQTGAPYLPKLAEVVQGYWDKIGVKTSIIPMDYSAFRSVRNELKKDDLLGKASASRGDQAPMAPRELESIYSTNGSHSLLNKAFPEVDKLIADALSEMDAAKRKDMLDKAIKIASEAYVCLPIVDVPAIVIITQKIEIDFPPGAPGIACFLDQARHK